MNPKIALASAMLPGAILLGCSEKPTPPPAQEVSGAGAAQPAAELPSEEACLELAQRIEETMDAGDPSAFKDAFDANRMLDTALAGLELSADQRNQFGAGVLSSFNLAEQICAGIAKDGSYRLLRFHSVAGERRALFRMITAGGVNYHDLILARGSNGTPKIVDIHIYLAGERMSATVRRGALPVLAEANKSIVEKLLGSESDFVANLGSIQKMQALSQQGKHSEALAECLKLPASLQKDRNILVQRVAIATQVDPTAHNAAVADYRKWHPNSAALHLMLIDCHFYRKDFAEALACVDALDEAVGGDPYLDFMRANLHHSAGRPTEARNSALKAIEDEPTLIQPHWTLLTLALEAKDFAEIARLLTVMEKKFSLRFDALEEAEPYAEFVKSPEYAKWLAARETRETEGTGDSEPGAAKP
jgi:tetratricopeptide (TPR) repeat protein